MLFHACLLGSGGWIRTTDLRVMSPTSCHCSTPRQLPAPVMPSSGATGGQQAWLFWWARGPCLPAPGEPVPSALRCFTTRFEMGRGGATALNARHWLRGAAPRQPTAASSSRSLSLPPSATATAGASRPRSWQAREALVHAHWLPPSVARPPGPAAHPSRLLGDLPVRDSEVSFFGRGSHLDAVSGSHFRP